MSMAQDKSVSASLIRREELPERGIVALTVDIDGESESIIVHCHDQGLTAWYNVCPHEGRRLDYAPGKFLIDKDRLVCAAHGASFRLADGECVSGPCRGESLRVVTVREDATGRLRFGEHQ
jgi:nitrite reductase/ring-hydroxylating ferredoxin subunit